MIKTKELLKLLYPFLIVFIIWEAICFLSFFPDYLLPRPSKVLILMVSLIKEGSLLTYAWVSFTNAFFGFLIGSSAGLLIATLSAFNKKIHSFFFPLISAAYPIPTIIWVPLALLWFGFDSKALIFVVSLGCFFAVFYNCLLGIKNINPVYLKMASNLKLTKKDFFKEIVFFGSFPYILLGLRLSISWSWRIIIGAEMLASTVKGLGWYLWISQEYFRYDQIFVGMITIACIGLLLEKYVFGIIEKHTIEKWG